MDEAENKALYTAVTGKTTAAAYEGGNSTSNSTIVVNGQAQDAGTTATTTNSSGQSITTVTVDASELALRIQSENGEISDELLAKITGGESLGYGERIDVRFNECPVCFARDSLVKGTESYAICNVCHKEFSERDVYRDFM